MEYKIVRRFVENVGYPSWVWLICILLFTPFIIILIIAHYFTDKVEMVEVEYKRKGAWLSKRKKMRASEFDDWVRKL